MLFLFHQFSTRKSSSRLNIFVYKSHYRIIWSFFSFEFSACFKFRRGFPNFRLGFRLLYICDWFTMYFRPFSVRVRIFGYMFDFSRGGKQTSPIFVTWWSTENWRHIRFQKFGWAARWASCKMDVRVFIVSFFLWPPLPRNYFSWIPEMLQSYWIIYLSRYIGKTEMFSTVLMAFSRQLHVQCHGEYVAIFKTGADQTFASRDSWFSEIVNLNSLWCVKYNEENASSNSLDC